ncbi:MAG: MafI family immunity protein [Pseudomonadota bacterium]
MSSSMEKRDWETQTVTLINRFRGRLDDQRLDEYVELAVHLEWGVALEMLCDQIFECDITPDDEEISRIIALGSDIGIAPKYWKHWRVK